MARIFPSKQVGQLYVVNSTAAPTTIPTNLGQACVFITDAGSANPYLYIQHVGKGGLTRSDLIAVKNIESVVVAPIEGRKLHEVLIEPNNAAFPGGNAIPGEVYTLNVEIQKFFGMAEDSNLIKFGTAVGTTSMSKAQLLYKVYESLEKNLRKESNVVTVAKVPSDATSSTITGIKLVEAQPDWDIEFGSNEPRPIIPHPVVVTDTGGNDIVWADVVYPNGMKYVGGAVETVTVTPTAIPSVMTPQPTEAPAHTAAEMEYFYMGERADQYRKGGYPNYIKTQLMVDPASTTSLSLIDVHYSFTDTNESSYKSEKDLLIIVPSSIATGLADSIQKAVKDYANGPSSTAAPTQVPTA